MISNIFNNQFFIISVISIVVIYMYFYKYQKYKSKYSSLPTGNIKGGGDIRRIRGSLYGLAIGDALGARYEFLYASGAKKKISDDMIDDYVPILGEGPFNIEKGQVTDDTEMMISLLDAICKNNNYDQELVAKKYIRWFNTKPPDIGNTITRALFTRKKSKNASDMINNSKELNMTSLSNGLLMRICPLGILGAINKKTNLKKITSLEGDLTHPNPINKAGAYIYCLAIKMAIKGYDKKVIFDKIMVVAQDTPRLRIILSDAYVAPEPTYIIDDMKNEIYVNTDDIRYQGYLGVALQNTFYELLHGESYERSMIDIIKRGGDTDTNCAIAGGLLGAIYGIDNIDKRWLNSIKKADVKRYETYPFLSPKMIDKSIKKLIPKH